MSQNESSISPVRSTKGMRTRGSPLFGRKNGQVFLSRVSFIQMIDRAGLLDQITSGVIQIRVEFRFLQNLCRLQLQEFDLLGDDVEFTSGDAARALVRVLHLHRQGDQVIGIRSLVRPGSGHELNAARSGVGLHEGE